MNKQAAVYASWLDTQQWDYFSTLTYKFDVRSKANRTNMDRMITDIKSKDKNFNMFWVAEWHRSGTSLHNHLLVKGDITQDISNYWLSNGLGISRYIKHLKYEKNKGAHFYVSKYLDRDVDYDYI